MKASEIFVEYTSPIQDAVPANASELQKILRVPELVWNAVVMEKKKRKIGELPEILKNHLSSMPPKEREMTEALLKFWVARKDQLFGDHKWPIVVEIYKNVKDALIIRVQVHEPRFASDIPAEWKKPKSHAQILPLPARK